MPGPAIRARPHAQRADALVGHAQVERLDPGPAGGQRALVGGRAGGDGEHGAGAVGEHEARVERARGGADHLRQPGARLDRVGDRVQRRRSGPVSKRCAGMDMDR